MISAIILDPDQVVSVRDHLDGGHEAGAKSAVIFLASEEAEAKHLSRMADEWAQGDPPRGLPHPDMAYAGPVWVVATNLTVAEMLQGLEPRG